jgi:hypothetical protein
MSLTIDRGPYTAQYLNGLWDDTRDTLWSVLPPALSFLTDKFFNQIEISEEDPESDEIVDPESLVIALITKANRMSDYNLSVVIQGTQVDVSVFDRIGEFGGRVSTIIPDYSDIVNPNFSYNTSITNQFWVSAIFQNQYNMVNQPNLVDAKDFILNDSMVSYPSYIDSTTNNNFAMSTFFNANSLANSLMTGGNQLLIGNEDSDFIDINLNQNSSNNYLANMNISKDRVPIKNLSIQNPISVSQNSFIRMDTGLQVPISLLPKTTLTKALELTVRSTTLVEVSRPFDFKPHAKLTFDLTTNTVSSYEKIVNNESGQGWFNTGYLGSEEFDGLGFDEWNIGKKKILTTMNLGLKVNSVGAFSNGFEDWFVGNSNELSEELNWNDFAEGITPKKPNCSSDASANGVTENLTSQVNGSNQVFNTKNNYESGTLKVYWNGQRQHDVTITELTSTTFRTTFIPLVGNSIVVDYLSI